MFPVEPNLNNILSNELQSLESDMVDTDKTISDFCNELNIKAPF